MHVVYNVMHQETRLSIVQGTKEFVNVLCGLLVWAIKRANMYPVGIIYESENETHSGDELIRC